MTPDERCARCGDPLPGANPDNLDVCVPCDTIVGLEIERDELLAEVARLRAELEAAEKQRDYWKSRMEEAWERADQEAYERIKRWVAAELEAGGT